MTADLLLTLDLLAALKTHLSGILHPDQTTPGTKLFEVVEFYEDKNIAEALQDLIIVKKRVCLIVPAGDHFILAKEGRTQRSVRTTSIDLVMGDVAYVKGGKDAAFSGAGNVGVVAMKDIVLISLANNAQLSGLRWCGLYPTDGAFISLSADDEKKMPGRKIFAVNYETPSGWITSPLTGTWPA